MKPLFVASSYSAENNSSIISIYKQLGSITLIGKGTEEENSLFQPTKSFSNANDILNLKWINNKYLGIVTQKFVKMVDSTFDILSYWDIHSLEAYCDTIQQHANLGNITASHLTDKAFAVSTDNGYIQVMPGLNSKSPAKRLKSNSPSFKPSAVLISNDTLYIGCINGTVHHWNYSSKKYDKGPIRPVVGESNKTNGAIKQLYQRDDTLIVQCKSEISSFDINNGIQKSIIRSYNYINDLTFINDSSSENDPSSLIATVGNDSILSLYDLKTPTKRNIEYTYPNTDSYESIDYNPNNYLFAIGTDGGNLMVIDLRKMDRLVDSLPATLQNNSCITNILWKLS